MLKTLLEHVVQGKDLSRNQAQEVMNEIMEGEATDAQIGAFLVAMRMKGEQPQELAGFATVMREKAARVDCADPANTLDIVGTGGDGKSTFNISTLAAFAAAGAGIPVAKHGNRSVSSKCGSADVLTALGVELDMSVAQLGECLAETGIAFLFAPKLHPAMRYAIGPRRELAIRTIFNMLGPITNPAGVERQLIGVYNLDTARLMGRVLQQLGARHILLVHSDDGMDEISLAAATTVIELKNEEISEYKISPQTFGLAASDASLAGGDAVENASIALKILKGERGPRRDVVIANAGAGIYAAGKAEDFREGAVIAARSIDCGAALDSLNRMAETTQRLARTNSGAGG